MRQIHTIPVPPGWSIEQSWEHIRRHGRLPAYEGQPSWANVEVNPATWRLVSVLPAEGEP